MAHRTIWLIAALIAAHSLSAQTMVNVDAGANRHPIDPNIYGVAWVNSTADLNTLGATLNRWGGNAVSRHNWEISTTNRCKDFFFINIPDDIGVEPVAGGSADKFIGMTRAGANAVQPVMTIPMMFLLPKDRTKRCSFSVLLYGAQQATAPLPYEDPDCGNGKRLADGTRITNNDTDDTAATYTLAHQTDWIEHMITRWGNAAAGGMRYYSLDNEPSLWSFDHWDVHPTGSTTDEVWEKMRDFGAAIKETDSAALVTGPEEWGWSGYFWSGFDQELINDGNQPPTDRPAHLGLPYVEYLLKKAKEYEDAESQRILDVFTLHFYPQNNEALTEDVSPTIQGKRNRSTRALWDPAYVDESWMKDVEGGIVKLIPRMKQWVANQYPGTKIGITEYNWGAENHINGATAQADVLGIFGREGLDMAIRWTSPVPPSFTAHAFQMYRNYDGSQSRFGDISISTGGPNPDEVSVFGALRSSNNTLTLMLISKTTGNKTTTVNLQRFQGATAERWQLDSTNVITHVADVPVTGSSVALTLPGQSITLLVIAGTTVPDAPLIGAAAPGETSASISFTAPANNGGSAITGYTATCNPGAVTGSGSASPVVVHGLTNGVAYTCSVAAVNAVGTGASSGTVGVTPAVPPGAASALIATATSTSQVSLTWTAGAGAINYQIHRSFNGSAYTLLDTSGVPAYEDNGLAPNTTYLYKVRAMNGGGETPFSEVNAATTIIFTDDPLTAGTPIKAVHVTQLRTAVNAMRTAAALGDMPFTDPGLGAGTLMKALHVMDLRSGLDAARALIGLPALTYTDPAITAGSTLAKTAHATELRNGVK